MGSAQFDDAIHAMPHIPPEQQLDLQAVGRHPELKPGSMAPHGQRICLAAGGGEFVRQPEPSNADNSASKPAKPSSTRPSSAVGNVEHPCPAIITASVITWFDTITRYKEAVTCANPANLSATTFTALGIDPDLRISDAQGRPTPSIELVEHYPSCLDDAATSL